MPNHQEDAPGDMARRVRRWATDKLAIGRSGGLVIAAAITADHQPPKAASTLDATIRPTGSGRYRRLEWAPGEPHLVRTDLGASPSADRADQRRSLLYVAHHTDLHICDAQSPARLEGGETFGWFNPGADGGHRPQETCTTHVMDQLVAATNAVATSALSGAAMSWCIQTGDNTDNRTQAELAWWMTLLQGGTVTPNTGVAGRYEGVQRSGWRGAWHPDDPSRDVYGKAGFPCLPGFLDAAVSPFEADGLDMPWLAVFGNHDLLYQGTFGPRVAAMGETLAGSGVKPRGALGLVRSHVHSWIAGTDPDRWRRWGSGPGLQAVTPDRAARASVPLSDYLQMMVAEGDHGFTQDNVTGNTSWWSRPEGDHVQVIGLDTCNHTMGSDGSMGPAQTAWLEDELQRHHSRWRDQAGREIAGAGTDRLVVLASHHNSWTMGNASDDIYDPGRRTTGVELVALIARYPNVVLWLNGHSHEHKILVHPGATTGSGCWEVDTASGIDFGQQGRTIEVFDNGNDTVSIFSTVIDHAAAPAVAHRHDRDWTVPELASMSRELAANDNRWIDPIALLGGPEDRNVELVVKAPFDLSARA